MKRPTKKPKEIQEYCHSMESWTVYTPDELIDIARKMKNEGVISFCITQEWDTVEFMQKRMETEEEAERRYKEEYKRWKIFKQTDAERKESRKKELIKEAKKLGLEVRE